MIAYIKGIIVAKGDPFLKGNIMQIRTALAMLLALTLHEACTVEAASADMLKIEWQKRLSKEDITTFGYNPEVVQDVILTVVVLSTKERLLYTSVHYVSQGENTLGYGYENKFFFPGIYVRQFKTAQVVLTVTKLDALTKTEDKKKTSEALAQ